MRRLKTLRPLAAIAALTLMSALTQQAAARSWRINSNTTRKAHFADINAAMSSSDVVDGDTLYLDPGCLLTADQTVTKRVSIVGCGYFLTSGAIQEATISGQVSIKASNTKIEGVLFTSTSSKGSIYIGADYIIIERCKFPTCNVNGNYCDIQQCYITSYISGGDVTNASFRNNIFNYSEAGSSSYVYTPFYGTIKRATIQNNYIVARRYKASNYILNSVFQNCIIKDNIIVSPSAPNALINGPVNCIIVNNVFSCTEGTYVSYPNNTCIGSADEATLFALEGTNDQRYTLKADSPAKGAATDGGDCGPTGGLYPYVPSGFPFGMPRFQSSTISPRPQSGEVKVTQQVSIQNQ